MQLIPGWSATLSDLVRWVALTIVREASTISRPCLHLNVLNGESLACTVRRVVNMGDRKQEVTLRLDGV